MLCQARPDITAHTLNGTLVGKHNAHYNQDEFLGIPYAQPPLGDLRFRSPVSLNETWDGPRGAIDYSPIVGSPAGDDPLRCFSSSMPQANFLAKHSAWVMGYVNRVFLAGMCYPTDLIINQGDSNTFESNEDCLTLNVVRPSGVKLGAELPVMVWLYG
jgi:carboxylesterase type B